MSLYKFPLSQEAALCGVYIYTSSTSVGLKSRDALRRDFLSAYEQKYRDSLAKRNMRRTRQLDSVATEPDQQVLKESGVAEAPNSAFDFMKAVQGIKNAESSGVRGSTEDSVEPSQTEEWVSSGVDLFSVVTKEDTHKLDTVDWVSSGTELFSINISKVETPATVEPSYEWVSHGTELFSVKVPIADSPKVTPVPDVRPEGDDIWDEPSEVVWQEDDGGFEDPINDESSFTTDEDEDLFEDWEEGPYEEEGDYEEDSGNPVVSSVERPVAPATPIINKNPVARPAGVVRTNTTTPPPAAPVPERKSVSAGNPPSYKLDENAVREFVKSNRLCTEGDICRAFSDYDPAKVRQCIKSALRKYRIFEKHGRFTI